MKRLTGVKLALALFAGLALTACDTAQMETETFASRGMYAATEDNGFAVPAINPAYLNAERVRQVVDYYAPYPEGTIVVDPEGRRLYHLLGDNKAMRYTVGVGKAGYGLTGEARVALKRDWPYWTPTQNMLRREPEKYGPVRAGLEGGLDNPLGARALYLYRGGRDTLYRIHGTPYPWTVGETESGGCIRMFNQDAIHLAAQVDTGTRVIILPKSQAGKWTGVSGESPAA
ncbi:L,D-transpeptidase [Maritimibacter harenae]|nr:L,D-transpeptidase [Maritimibacter harenae]